MKRRFSCLGAIGAIALALAVGVPSVSNALSEEYMRNGECYLLIGEGNSNLKGVFRLNNPSQSKVYNPAIKVISPGSTLGFDVDLDRVIYTFSEEKDSAWKLDTEPLYRQVLDDTVANRLADYGYHTWIHYDHRRWKTRSDGTSCANVYRSGAVGRDILNSSQRVWSGFKGAGQGTPTTKPSGYTLPVMTGAASLGEYSGKPWFKIPNESWYSCWKTGAAVSNGFTYFYFVMGDKVQSLSHNYYLYRWNPSNKNADNPGYGSGIKGSSVATTKDIKVSRNILAGCLDGCGGASGSGSGPADEKISDTAFQPPLKGGSARTYFYSRTKGKTDWQIQLTNGGTTRNINFGGSDKLIGDPGDVNTFWLEVSLKDRSNDYIYAIGTKTIKDWFKIVNNNDLGNSQISAVCVSNQWDQAGGIIYAYDKTKRNIYKFERNEKLGNPLTGEGAFEVYGADDIMNKIGAASNSEIDDMRADGFGNLYFALSHPSINPDSWNPTSYFKLSDAIDVKFVSSGEQTDFQLLYKQPYGKVVFSRDYLSGDITEIGRKDFAVRYYTLSVRINNKGWNEVNGLGKNFAKLPKVLASWTATIGSLKITSTEDKPNGLASRFSRGVGNFTGYSEYNYTNPGQTMLAVINVPTPPRVVSLGGKQSYLDIVGPYPESFPQADTVNRSTCQDTGLLNSSINLESDKLYWFMVENYPLSDGAQNPLEQPDWDNDGRRGGFITSLQDPAPKSDTHKNGVEYYWTTWVVMDQYDAPCLKVINTAENTPYCYFFYPTKGRFIMTCAVRYNWYDYDALPFGSTVEDLSSVLKTGTWAVPVATNKLETQKSRERLNEIKNMEKFSFMKNPPVDINGQPKFDYSRILYAVNSDGSKGNELENLAMIPIICPIKKPDPDPVVYSASISRCDEIKGYDPSNYLKNNAFWASTSGEFGIEAGESYYWRMDIASQTNLFRDISKCNNINDPNSPYFNFVAQQMLTQGSPIYEKDKEVSNDVGDFAWFDDNITYRASLEYDVPDGNGGKKTINMPISIGDSGSASSTEFVKTLTVHNTPAGANVFDYVNNKPLYVKTGGDLPPSDPYVATLKITMSRMFWYSYYRNVNGVQKKFDKVAVKQLSITGTAKVLIVDTGKPAFNLRKTSPNNLFGVTGLNLKSDDGPAGLKNPSEVRFTLTDNNPWETIENVAGISLAQHLTNYSYNYGNTAFYNYISNCPADSVVRSTASGVSVTSNGIKSQIADLKSKRQRSSHLNYRRLYSRAAREVRFSFETARRQTGASGTGSDKLNGRISVGINDLDGGRRFSSDKLGYNDYCYHYHNGSLSKKHISINPNASSFVQKGTTDVYSSIVEYMLSTDKIYMGEGTNNKIPDGYANNTPGYTPYKFYVSAVDSSGNYTGNVELNLRLNVKDNIPPIGYGCVVNMKNDEVSKFPYKSASTTTKGDNSYVPMPGFTGQSYNGSMLPGSIWKDLNWLPDKSKSGYINGLVSSSNYQALPSISNDIVKLTDGDTRNLIRAGLNPRPVEDNVECLFRVYCSDNAGSASATMRIKYYASRDNGGTASSFSILNGYSSAKVNTSNSYIATDTVKTHGRSLVFRGSENQFPMAVPVVIETVDNAMDWNYFNWDANSGKWGTTSIGGQSAPNRRTFKTTLPVYGSSVDVRTIEKSTKND